jgi:hypothetical protein
MTGSAAAVKRPQGPTAVTLRLRRKLSFPGALRVRLRAMHSGVVKLAGAWSLRIGDSSSRTSCP